MLTHFEMNGLEWTVRFTYSSDPVLIDRTDSYTLGVTDSSTQTIYLSSALHGELLTRVLIHELGHSAMVSYNLLPQLHRMVKKRYWIEAEEWCCNLLADYGEEIFRDAYRVLGDKAIGVVPIELCRVVA